MSEHQRVDIKKSQSLLQRYLLAQMPVPGDYETGLKGVRIYRRDETAEPVASIYNPMIIKMIQGSKNVEFGGTMYHYGESDILVTGIDIPGSGVFCDAEPTRPSLSIAIDLDSDIITQLAMEIPTTLYLPTGKVRGVFVQPENDHLLDAYVRLGELLKEPGRLQILGPMIVREIHYLLLIGPNGDKLRAFHLPGTGRNQVANAISWLKQNIPAAVSIDTLAEMVGMASSTFYRHFKEVAGVSPLQFHKLLQLHEAQRLMLTQNMTASNASINVGYSNLSQFNREYKQRFGAPPSSDIRRLRNETLALSHGQSRP